MKLTAINAKTGAVLMSQSGAMSQDSFKRTVSHNFPELEDSQIIIMVDGSTVPTTPGKKGSKNQRSVVWRGSFTDLGGYANMNREIVLRLAHHGFSVKIEMLKTGLQVDPSTLNLLRAMESSRLANESSCPLVIGFTPMPVRASRKVIFYTMMETQRLHPEFVSRCNQSASEVWVPCGFYERVFRESGVMKPITVIPLGVNQHLYVPGSPPPSVSYEEMPSGARTQRVVGGYKFMSLFGWSYRKGTDVLCRSFLKEFDASDDVALVIYSRYMGSAAEVHKEYVRAEIRGYYAECGKPNPARIYYCGDEIPIPDLPGAYCAADCFVFCSRGEGFGLPVIEAAACGLPIVSSYNTSMTSYLDDDCARLVRPEGVAPANDKLTWISGYYRDQEFAVMGDASIAEFGAHMRALASNPQEGAAMAKKLRDKVLEKYTWDVCTMRVAQRLSNG